jgi:bifunctional DNase/RNase
VGSVIEVEIDAIRVNLSNYQRVVILREKGSARCLPIWIGAFEAEAITHRLQGISGPRPQTHDLLSTTIDQLGGKVRSVVVSDMTNDVYYARIEVDQDGKSIEIDSRPSDALALAVRQEVPIYVEDAVLAVHGHVISEQGEDDDTGAATSPSAVTPEELEKLSAFQDFISELDLDDLGKSDD